MWPVASAAIILAVACATSAREIPSGSIARIHGGHDAPDGGYPYTVSLRVYFEHFCGGSILNNYWVLTSAHCLLGKRADEISVIAGTNHLTEAGQMYQATFIISHPQYDGTKLINDVGLIHVSRKIMYTKKIQPMPLANQNFDDIDYPAVFTGWGTTQAGGGLPDLLQEIQLKVISQKVCAEKNNLVGPTQICTLSTVGKGACKGDAGGPLVADGVQIGIFSFSQGCAAGYPDVFTRVYSFVSWIENTIEKNNHLHG